MTDNFSMSKINLEGQHSPILAKKELSQENRISFLSRFNNKKGLFIVSFASVFFIFYFLVSILFIVRNGRNFYHSLILLKESFASRNLEEIDKNIKYSRYSLDKLDKSFNFVRWMKFIPILGVYFTDLERGIRASYYSFDVIDISVDTFGDYLDLLGFTTGASSSGTTVDRIGFITKALPEVLPKTGVILEKIRLVEREISQIDAKRYPVRLGKTEVRKKISDLVEKTSDILISFEKSESFLQRLPYILGIDAPRSYLVIFQNDKELRPTGGFMTAYSVLKVDKATFNPVISDDIYNLDSKYRPTELAPEPIIKYLKGPYSLSPKWRLRDMNWYPDFGDSMELFTREISKLGLDGIDGVIAVDTQVLVDILGVLGSIDVPGYGRFSNELVPECNCPQIIYELESFADVEGPVVWDPAGTGKIVYAPANWENRKKIIGPLMNAIAAHSLGQPAEKIADLFSVFLRAWKGRHILFYFKSDDVQQAARDFDIAGKLVDFDGDYLLVNDANLGGRKSNLYVIQEVQQEIKEKGDGFLEKTLVITYKNPEKYDGWLNSVLPNWVRIYVPKGSRLISIEGLENTVEPYEEYGKNVFAGFFELRPQGIAKVEVRYDVPIVSKDGYKLYIQKQPGKPGFLYTTKFGKKIKEFYLDTDRLINFSR